MLTKKEIKEMVKSELHTIAVYSTCDNLRKYIPYYEQRMVKMIEAMLEVYNYQHNKILFKDEVVESVLKESQEIKERLECWYNIYEERYIALEIIYKHK